jgi:hypothetical protein
MDANSNHTKPTSINNEWARLSAFKYIVLLKVFYYSNTTISSVKNFLSLSVVTPLDLLAAATRDINKVIAILKFIFDGKTIYFVSTLLKGRWRRICHYRQHRYDMTRHKLRFNK